MTLTRCTCYPDYGTPDAPSLDVNDDCPRHREGGPEGNPRGTEAADFRAQIVNALALHYREPWGTCATCTDNDLPGSQGLTWPCPTVLALGGGVDVF